MKKRSLKEIALYLLKRYELSELEVIGEFSGNIKEDEARLQEEIAELRREIEEADSNQFTVWQRNLFNSFLKYRKIMADYEKS